MLHRGRSAITARTNSAEIAKKPSVSTRAGISLTPSHVSRNPVKQSDIVPVDTIQHRFKSDSLQFEGNLITVPVNKLPSFELVGLNNDRRSITIQNLSETQDIFLSFGNGSSLNGAIQIKPGSCISYENGICPNNEIAIGARQTIGLVAINLNVEVSIVQGFIYG